MAKHSVYNAEVVEVKPLGYTKLGNQRYMVTVCDERGNSQVRNTRGNSSVNYIAGTLLEGDMVDVITDGRGSVVAFNIIKIKWTEPA